MRVNIAQLRSKPAAMNLTRPTFWEIFAERCIKCRKEKLKLPTGPKFRFNSVRTVAMRARRQKMDLKIKEVVELVAEAVE